MTIIKSKRTSGKIKPGYGIKDYYKFFKENNSELNIDFKTYKKVIEMFNSELINLIIEDNIEYTLPYLGSTLSIKKDKRLPKIVNGKLYNTAPVDWVKTNELWNSDSEAKEKKLLVRYLNSHTSKYVFRIYFRKYKLPFKNKQFYSFKSSRNFQRTLSKRINDENKEKYESFLLY